MLDPSYQPKAHTRKRVVLLVACVLALVACFALLAGVVVSSSSSSSSSESTRSSSESSDSSVKPGSERKVSVTLYGESLCPDCRHMVLDVIAPMMKNGLGDVMDLRYVAYGNVRREKDSADGIEGIQCQHGSQECLMNKYINCAQEDGIGNSDAAVWFPYVACLAEDLAAIRSTENYEDTSRKCASQSGLSASLLKDCAEGPHGAVLEVQAGKETDALVPQHKFVPWMVVNGAAIGSDYDNLDRFVCVGIGSGDLMPAACSELRSSLMHQR